jgi:large subunit ribosomal protein L35
MAKNKIKTCRSLAKRLMVTGGGKIKRMKSGKSHLLTCKSRKRKRDLRHSALVDTTLVWALNRMAPYL